MKSIEKNETPNISIEGKLNSLPENFNSVQVERLVELCRNNVDSNDLNRVCSVLNEDFYLLLSEKMDFNLILKSKIKNPIGKIS